MSEMMLCVKNTTHHLFRLWWRFGQYFFLSRMYCRPRPPTEVSQNPINATGSVLPHFAITIRYAIVARSYLVI